MLAAMRGAGLRAILDLSCYRNFLQNYLLLQGSSTTPYSYDWSPFVRFVARRVNTVNGIPYRRDPTIAIVSFAGEPNPPNSQEPLKPTTDELTTFYRTVFATWKNYDRNHLVSSGGLLHIDWEGVYGSSSGIDWQAIFSLAQNDVPSIHSYWHVMPPTADTDYRSPKVSAYCLGIRKPWLTEEFGWLQQPVDESTSPPTTYTEQDRADWYSLVYDIQRGAYSSIAPSAGAAFWNLGAEVDPASHDVNPQTPATWSVVQANAPA
jgi:endo-1,4-beta-mannosidase